MVDFVFGFVSGQTPLEQAIHGHHNALLVAVSILIAILAASASFNHARLMRNASSTLARSGWHLSGAIAMGLGVWAMHFTGMMSYQLPVTTHYQVTMTVVSVLPAVMAAFFALRVVEKQRPSVPKLVTGGVLMGSGIGAMHYLGMAAMVLPAQRLYQPGVFVLSIGAAVALAIASLSLQPWLRERLQRRFAALVISSVVMGAAIASMHYVAMHATVFIPTDTLQGLRGPAMASDTLGLVAVVVAVTLVSLSTFVVVMRRRVQVAERSSERLQQEAARIENRLQRIAQRVPGLVHQFKLHDDGRFTFPYASEAVVEFYNLTPENARVDAMPVLESVHPDDRDALRRSIQESARAMVPWQHEYRVPGERSTWRWLQGNAVPEADTDGVLWSGIITDISDRKRADETIRRLAYFDDLTGLPNRRRLLEHLGEAVFRASSSDVDGVALIVLDVDRFKRVNDTLGHAAGDALLRTVADRLSSSLSERTIIGRLGSDEFAILVQGVDRDQATASRQLISMAGEIQSHLGEPFVVHGTRFQGAVNVGIYICRDVSLSEEEMLRRANIALGHAKQAGEASLRLFDPSMFEQLRERFDLEHALRDALVNNELVLYYQPQVDANGLAVGVEALLRWQHPDRGMVSPGVFIPLAEESGLIEPIGAWVLEQACEQLAHWHQDARFNTLTLSVNVSARQFYSSDFLPQLKQLLASYSFEQGRLVLELTESLVLADLDDAVRRMNAIKALGVQFAMDDFGTGYSSLSYLSRLPFNEVKIDQYFIHKSPDGERRDEWVIVEAIIGIARTFGMNLVAEGVETQPQVALLRSGGCGCFQGFLFARPMPAEDLEAWLDRTGPSASRAEVISQE